MAVLAHHIVFCTYGFWLPNDPRGSWSEVVGSWEIFRFGKATKTNTRRSVAGEKHDKGLRLRAKTALKHPCVSLTGTQALSVARGFDRVRKESNYAMHACSILPEHVHLVIGRNDRLIGNITGHIKRRATQQLRKEGLLEGKNPVWARGYWNVYLDTNEKVKRAISYVENNPIKEDRKPQKWSFVIPFVPDLI